MDNQDQKVINANEQIQKQFYDRETATDMDYLSDQTHQSKETMEANMNIQNRFYSDKKRDSITFYSNNNMAAVFMNEDEKKTD
ncbi:hypothetical protein ACFFIX_00915 [Metabacillus herbersteinensis]|uniref:Uncharacterized protein n=1 Tax=Metabacillus herbersteinensis TaxID=283816 RepID=A0ABV6G8L7_9BACI